MDTNDDLKKMLNAWEVEVDLPAGFQREVWARIAARTPERERLGWRPFLEAFSLQVAKPAFAALLLLVALTSSLAVAHANAREANSKRWQAVESHYFASLDPYSHLSSP